MIYFGDDRGNRTSVRLYEVLNCTIVQIHDEVYSTYCNKSEASRLERMGSSWFARRGMDEMGLLLEPSAEHKNTIAMELPRLFHYRFLQMLLSAFQVLLCCVEASR